MNKINTSINDNVTLGLFDDISKIEETLEIAQKNLDKHMHHLLCEAFPWMDDPDIHITNSYWYKDKISSTSIKRYFDVNLLTYNKKDSRIGVYCIKTYLKEPRIDIYKI